MKLIKYFRVVNKVTSALVYYGITCLIPKDKSLWIFGSWKGKNYSDNSKALFEYVSREKKNINAVWIAKNKRVFDEVSALGYNVAYYPSLRAKWIVARAAVNVQTESNQDTGSYRVGGAIIIQLFHSFIGLKDVYLFNGMSKIKKKLVEIIAEKHSKSYWMVSSDYCLQTYPSFVDASPKRLYVTGLPRTDVLLGFRKVDFFESYKKTHCDAKLIIYAPTHRSYGKNGIKVLNSFEWEQLEEFLIKMNYILFFKPHPNEIDLYKKDFGSYNNIILVDDNYKLPKDPCEYLHYFDLLISDYSSISLDFIAFNKPVVLYVPDFNSFDDGEFTLDSFNKFAGGPICDNIEKLKLNIQKCIENDDSFEKRKDVIQLVYKYLDNRNCERVYNQILKIIE